MEPKIIFEDEHLLVINKPAGMVVNKSETTRGEETVQDWTEKYLKIPPVGKVAQVSQAFDTRDTFYQRAGIVHRLDKETSGLLLIAKTPEAFVNLQAQFKNRQVKKKYVALVHGKVMPEEGEINAPIGRLPWNRQRFGVMPGGREAVTKYKLVKYYNDEARGGHPPEADRADLSASSSFSLLELSPETGRTHQIRVHLKYLGFPIVGDNFYAGRKQGCEDRKYCPRVFLHAGYLEFFHPESQEKIKFELTLPKDLEEVLWKISNSPGT